MWFSQPVALPGLPREASYMHPDKPREPPLHGDAPARLVDDVETLVEPDGDIRTNTADELGGDAALTLRERARP